MALWWLTLRIGIEQAAPLKDALSSTYRLS